MDDYRRSSDTGGSYPLRSATTRAWPMAQAAATQRMGIFSWSWWSGDHTPPIFGRHSSSPETGRTPEMGRCNDHGLGGRVGTLTRAGSPAEAVKGAHQAVVNVQRRDSSGPARARHANTHWIAGRTADDVVAGS